MGRRSKPLGRFRGRLIAGYQHNGYAIVGGYQRVDGGLTEICPPVDLPNRTRIVAMTENAWLAPIEPW